MRKDRFTDEALAQAKALAELKYSESPEDQLAFSEAYDFARCQRADGSFYGIPDGKQCKKGTKAAPAEPKPKKSAKERMAAAHDRGVKSGKIKVSKPKIDENKLYRLAQKRKEILEKLERERGLLERMSKAKGAEPMRKAREEKIEKLKKSYDRLNELRSAANKKLDDKARTTGRPRPLIPSNYDTTPKQERAASKPKAKGMKTDFRKEVQEGAAKRKKRDAEIAKLQRRYAKIKALSRKAPVAKNKMKLEKVEKLAKRIGDELEKINNQMKVYTGGV